MNTKLKTLCLRIHWVIGVQFGIDFRTMFRFLKSLPRYIRDLQQFRSGYTGRIDFMPCLHDWYEEAGSTKDEYFLQDLLVARMIFEAKPERHVDIGSRVDGFVAHVASFREIEVFDMRPIVSQIPGVQFTQADLMKPVEGKRGYCDSLSCLHALEHFGLGRYRDLIDPKGFESGLANMAMLIKNQGTFYLSVPIGVERVEFNANHVFDPRVIVKLAAKNLFHLTALILIRQNGKVEMSALDDVKLTDLAREKYVLGIFIFKKKSSSPKREA
ncbi:MAG: DUF268 domain-containing protein [Proteobacteria bacterium]|nr:DUF268 domain-containing protein [Pseudomonadota bacterium]MBU2631381.1 DUF268 domain-containing protein [Pseudomonadota bacterium]